MAKVHRASATSTGNPVVLTVNRLTFSVTSVGGLSQTMDAPESWWDGWNETENYFDPVYDHGLWVTAKRNGLSGVAAHVWSSSFVPGPVVNGKPAMDSPRYRPYTITAGESPVVNPDIAAWPADLGAPVDSNGQPLISGNQMAWTVYNAADTTVHPWYFSSQLPPRAQLPVEVRYTAFAHFSERADSGVWANAVFLQWALFNKGPDPLDSVFLTLWTDIDFIDAYHTIPAVDTGRQIGYCWYGRDSSYGAIGYTLLYGPVTPSSGDTAVFFGSPKPGFRNLPMSSFVPLAYEFPVNVWYVPRNYSEILNVAHGLLPTGAPMIDSTTGLPTFFPAAGDPLTMTGMVFHLLWTDGEAGLAINPGPFTLAPGDSQWIMMALTPTEKVGGVDAITRLRSYADQLHALPYDSLVTRKPRRNVPIGPLPTFDIPKIFVAKPVYPNPFNGRTLFPFELPEDCAVRIDIFDLLGRHIETPVEGRFERGYRTFSWYPAVRSGVYFARMEVRSLESAFTWSRVTKLVLIK